MTYLIIKKKAIEALKKFKTREDALEFMESNDVSSLIFEIPNGRKGRCGGIQFIF